MEIKVFTPKFECADYCGYVTDSKLIYRGYVELNRVFNIEKVFDLCNWSCWCENKPKEVYTDIEVIGHGLVVLNPKTNKYHLALSAGWLTGTREEIENYIEKYKNQIIWTKDGESWDELVEETYKTAIRIL